MQKPSGKILRYIFLGIVLAVALLEFNLFASWTLTESPSSSSSLYHSARTTTAVSDTVKAQKEERCAINFWGLPRAFESLVLPSVTRNIIEQNAAYNCDYYVHYYYKTEESAGRSGQGGLINPKEILLLKDAVLASAKAHGHARPPIVEFTFDTEEDFWKKHGPLIDKIRKTKVQGKYLYFPWRARTYQHPVTTDNIVKMWHTIQSAFQLMEKSGIDKNIYYSVVAMFRSDVVYVTPIDIRDTDETVATATIPNFGKHPVSDRCIYGAAGAVRIWSMERFSRLEDHVAFVQENDPGWGMHSERFVNYTLLPPIREIAKVRQHETMCFLRARADESVWITDCEGTGSAVAIRKNLGDVRVAVETAIGRPCLGNVTRLTRLVKSLDCARQE